MRYAAARMKRRPTSLDALRESEARYRELFENATAPMATFTLDGRFTAINRAYEDILGFTREELIGQPLARVLTPAGGALAAERARRAAAGEKVPSTFEIEVRTKAGAVHPAEGSVAGIHG